MEADGVPRFLKQCTQIIEEKGLKTEGIYRVSGKKDVCLELQDQYDMGIKYNSLCFNSLWTILKLSNKRDPAKVSLTLLYQHYRERCPSFGG